jgi:alkylation response protein AidB-like acyl-CoA dehydrogenase
MPLILNEEEVLLKYSAKELFKLRGSIEKNLRHLRDTKDETGFDTMLWEEIASFGWTALVVPEKYFGLDFGYVGLGQVLEESGRTLTPTPLISTVLLSTTAINLAGNDAQKEALLTQISEGKLVVAFAHEEGRHHHPELINTTIQKSGDKLVLNGKKTLVLDGHIADKLVVVARAEDGQVQFVVLDGKQTGVTRERTIMMDSRNAAKITFKNVEITADNILTGADAVYHQVLDIGRIGIAAEMLGGIQEVFERTMDYIKTREQFGVRIGTFQALQHRAAKMFCEIEICKSVILKALKAIDEKDENLPLMASLAKSKLGETYKVVSNEGIQMFGGIGVTDDEEIGFFMKRARVAQQTLGDYNFHIDRYASLKGY